MNTSYYRVCAALIAIAVGISAECAIGAPQIPRSAVGEAERRLTAADYFGASNVMRPHAEAGNAQAMFACGYYMIAGTEATKLSASAKIQIQQKAIRWIEKAAVLGEHSAAVFLSAAYGKGEYTLPKDPAKAKYWRKRSQKK